METIHIGDLSIGTGNLVLIAGPCVIESEEHARFMAQSLAGIAGRLDMPFIYKASFDKANRSSIESYRGPGMEKGLDILSGIKQDFGIAVTTDIHEPAQAGPAARSSISFRYLRFCAGRPISWLPQATQVFRSMSKKGSSWPPGTW